MKLKTMRCPNCGAELNFDENARQAKCEYCLSTIKIEDDSCYGVHIEQENKGRQKISFTEPIPVNSRNVHTAAKIIITIVQVIFGFWAIMFLAAGVMLILEGDTAASVIAFVFCAVFILLPLFVRKKILKRLK